MNDLYTLIIIDIQESFLSKLKDKSKVINNCRIEINKAIDNKMPVVLVEYNRHGSTINSLKDLLFNYDQVWTITKNGDSGNRELVNILYDALLPKSLRVCGINTEFCVYETIFGFLYLTNKDGYKVKVVAPACDSGYNHLAGLKKFKKLQREYNQLEVVRCLE
jgi:nicotinamidase-related amidase